MRSEIGETCHGLGASGPRSRHAWRHLLFRLADIQAGATRKRRSPAAAQGRSPAAKTFVERPLDRARPLGRHCPMMQGRTSARRRLSWSDSRYMSSHGGMAPAPLKDHMQPATSNNLKPAAPTGMSPTRPREFRPLADSPPRSGPNHRPSTRGANIERLTRLGPPN